MVEYSRPMYSSSGLLPASAGAGTNLVFTPTTTGSTFGTVPLMGSTSSALPVPVDKIDLYEKRVIEQPVLHQVVHHPVQEIHQQHIRNDVYTPPVTQVVNEGDFSYSSLPMTRGVGMVPATATSGMVQQQPIGQGFIGSAPVSALSVPVPESRVPISTTQQYVGGGFAGTGVGAPSTYSDIGRQGLGGGGRAPGYGGGAGMGAGMGAGVGGYGAGMGTGFGTTGYGGTGAGYGGTKESFFEKRKRRKMEKAMMQQNQWPGAQPQQFGSTGPVSSGIIPGQQLPMTQPLLTQQQPMLQQTSVLPSSSFVGGGSSSMFGRSTGGGIPLSSGTYQSGIPSTTGSYINAPGSSRTGLF